MLEIRVLLLLFQILMNKISTVSSKVHLLCCSHHLCHPCAAYDFLLPIDFLSMLVHSTKAPWTGSIYITVFFNKVRIIDQIIWLVRAAHDRKSECLCLAAATRFWWVFHVHAWFDCDAHSGRQHCIRPISLFSAAALSCRTGVEHFISTITAESEPMFSPNVTSEPISGFIASTS